LLSKKPTWIRFIIPIGVFALVLLGETALINFFPTVKEFYDLLLLTALGGSFAMSLFLPHPRQERKRRELLLKQAQQDRIEGETLAEKRP
jgi:hypothetical protein